MKKKKILGICLSLLSLAPTCWAYDFVSKEGGYHINIPQGYMVIGSKADIMVYNQEVGLHGLSALNVRNPKHTVTTDKFLTDLKLMEKDITAGKDLMKEGKYPYLTAQENPLSKKLLQTMGKEGVFTYKISKVLGNPALEVNSDVKLDYDIALPQKIEEKERTRLGKIYPEAKFSPDGTKMQLNLVSKGTTYYFSKNNALYGLVHGYTERPALDLKTMTTGVEGDLAKKIKDIQGAAFNLKKYQQLSKDFAKSIKFTVPQPDASNLLVPSSVFTQNYQIPHNWLYVYSPVPMNNGKLDFMFALPYSTLEKLEKNSQDWEKNVQFNSKGKAVSIMADLKNLPTKYLLDVYQEGVVSVSAKTPPNVGFSKFLDKPELIKAFFNDFMKTNTTTNKLTTKYDKVIKVKNVDYNMDINSENCLVKVNGALALHIPATLGKIAEKDYNIFQDNKLVPFNSYVQSRFYFNRANEFNFSVYFKDKAIAADNQTQQAFDSFNLFQNIGLRSLGHKA